MFKKLIWLFLAIVVVVIFACGSVLYSLVIANPGDEIDQKNITSILGIESPVYYEDGKSRLGVFFNEAHRQYVLYEDIPVHFINALVASEDNRFFSHFGFDIQGILRAAVQNIQAGRVVGGGSTLTQQAAKNLFKREKRSYKEKLKELLFALRLEYRYSKEKIFEFYSNQFYVSGNGHGLGVAARYYFNKKVDELNLLECAYIAGSVKRPNYYNPFLAKNEQSKNRALRRGRERIRYVLERMRDQGFISEYQYSCAQESELEFHKGQVGYSLDYAMEMVRDAVSLPEVTEALEKYDIYNISTSGVKIFTTINKNLQEQTLYSLRHHLSRLDVRLRGYERDHVQSELAALDYKGDLKAEEHSFLFGRVLRVDFEKLFIEVDLGRKNGIGIIKKDGFSRLVKARVKWANTPWTEAHEDDYRDFLRQIQPQDTLWVSVTERTDDEILLDLEKFPEIQGAALVVKDGRIEAVSGGVENRFFNRAIYGKRTMGSAFKPFVYAAALQLGWSSVDKLVNSRDVFIFQNQPYFPRPDHHSPYETVSMSWAGVHSENVASVWLLTRLLDKLDRQEFFELAKKMGMTPHEIDGEVEPYSRYKNRIRDSYGIVMTRDLLRKAAFYHAVNHIEPDLLFIGRDKDYKAISRLHYGLDFSKFRDNVKKDMARDGIKSREIKELRLRLGLLNNSFLRLEKIQQQFELYRKGVNEKLQETTFFGIRLGGGRPGADSHRRSVYNLYQVAGGNVVFTNTMSDDKGIFIPPDEIVKRLGRMDKREQQAFWDDVLLDGRISLEAFEMLQRQVEQDYKTLGEKPLYSFEVLENVKDYRILAGLKYIISLGREMGIQSTLDPVLSFPLGSNVVTLFEMVRMYEGLITGNITDIKGADANKDLLFIIDRIESADGEVLYRPERHERKVLDEKSSLEIGHILENIVKYGTGRYADRNIKFGEKADRENSNGELRLSIPVLGKTGTANRYTNASFLGFLPVVADENHGVSINDGYAVGVYVGYDNNKEMKKGATRISGSAGALPIWSDIILALFDEKEYGAHLDVVDLSFNGLHIVRKDFGQRYYLADQKQGGIVAYPLTSVSEQDRYTPSILSFGKKNVDGRFLPERKFLPFWKQKMNLQNNEE